ncbi:MULTISPECIES: TlpA disulfide reductase family protein [unclassified Modicisalibacter]|uniref:TlpA family protein disulfide reductase n=1 Tax=unclassified Modicisalibacter TaxID=2679913 RepID=UPI001CCD7E6B|nr:MULTISPECIES: TlpA disulfide reductase family protein [unclassified Modicisalibacter]MBZ9558909.1 TlpA family protein disulfide reductase [Modicisalibacter sp. R2A 31.J]MBZ9575199.1 TlpA family protein disulfide reductase [Modicisalibacter sp. MOD 31.J]
MDALALGPLLIALPRLYAAIAALALLLAGMLALRLPVARRARWFNGALLAALLGARLGDVLAHLDSYAQAPLDAFKLWQPGYLPVAGLIAAAAWTAWSLRDRWPRLVAAEALLAGAAALWLALMAWNPLGGTSGLSRQPELTLEDLGGNPVALAELHGEPLIVNLWATWCGPCRREMPLLADAAATPGVTVVPINQGESLLAVARYLDQQGLDFEHALLDPHQQLLALSATPGLPTTLVFDAEGRLVERHVGELGRSQLEAWLAR